MRRVVLAVAGITLLLSLCGCVASVAPEADETYASASDAPVEPAPTATPQGALDTDIVLVVKATAVAANGARLVLEMRLHRSIAFDDVGGQTIPVAVAEGCPATLNQELFAEQAWSFARANVSALPDPASQGEWPSEARIETLPSADFVTVVGRGFIADDAQAAASVPSCERDKFFASQGNGAFAIGIPKDAAAGFTQWANHRYGFTLPEGAAGVTLTDCSVEVTDLGKQHGGAADSWASTIDDKNCSIGAAVETKD